MSRNQSRDTGAWMPVRYPASAVSAVRLTPGEAVHISPHDVLGHHIPRDEDAIVDEVMPDGWLIAVRWHPPGNPGLSGVTMFHPNCPLRRIGGAA
jgi:hypothetical protein